MTRDETIRLGESAKRLLSDETAMAAIEAIEERCKEAWANSSLEQITLRDDAFTMLRFSRLLIAQLEIWRDDATAEIKIFEQRQKDEHVLN